MSGFWSLSELPTSATPEEVLHKYFSAQQPYNLIRIRKMNYPGYGTFYAALVESKGKRQVFLVRHDSVAWTLREYQ